jgi:hypothetical protein
MDNKLLGFQTQLHNMEARLQEIEKNNQEQKKSTKEEEVDENNTLREKKIKELEDKLINNLGKKVWNTNWISNLSKRK